MSRCVLVDQLRAAILNGADRLLLGAGHHTVGEIVGAIGVDVEDAPPFDIVNDGASQGTRYCWATVAPSETSLADDLIIDIGGAMHDDSTSTSLVVVPTLQSIET